LLQLLFLKLLFLGRRWHCLCECEAWSGVRPG
jgi:hypothetical protein